MLCLGSCLIKLIFFYRIGLLTSNNTTIMGNNSSSSHNGQGIQPNWNISGGPGEHVLGAAGSAVGNHFGGPAGGYVGGKIGEGVGRMTDIGAEMQGRQIQADYQGALNSGMSPNDAARYATNVNNVQ